MCVEHVLNVIKHTLNNIKKLHAGHITVTLSMPNLTQCDSMQFDPNSMQFDAIRRIIRRHPKIAKLCVE